MLIIFRPAAGPAKDASVRINIPWVIFIRLKVVAAKVHILSADPHLFSVAVPQNFAIVAFAIVAAAALGQFPFGWLVAIIVACKCCGCAEPAITAVITNSFFITASTS